MYLRRTIEYFPNMPKNSDANPQHRLNLIAKRKALGVSRVEFCSRYPLHPETLRKWERGVTNIPRVWVDFLNLD